MKGPRLRTQMSHRCSDMDGTIAVLKRPFRTPPGRYHGTTPGPEDDDTFWVSTTLAMGRHPIAISGENREVPLWEYSVTLIVRYLPPNTL